MAGQSSTESKATEVSPAPPDFTPEREIRFAVVMYGGVSLAVYIDGVAQELLRLVRATAPAVAADQESRPALLAPNELSGSERIYRKLGQICGAKASTSSVKPSDPIRRRFVVDILSGTSAGGINGIFLAKALANNQSLNQIKQLWIREGDFSLLLNDKAPPCVGAKVQSPPQSLLNSRRMYLKLLQAFEAMESKASPPGASPLVNELDLFVTTTDIDGLTLPIQLSDEIVYERRYRNVFHLVYGTQNASGSDRNDFLGANNPFLAYAGRCTSSFPFAFEPMVLSDISRLPPYDQNPNQFGKDCERWREFFKDYLRPVDGVTPSVENFKARSFGDGGYLDNKPFTYATETLLRRHASLPVERKLIYIEPSPEHPEDYPTPAGKPDVIANVEAALLTLPRKETIRQDIENLMDRNRFLERVRRILSKVEEDVKRSQTERSAPIKGDDWAAKGLTEMIQKYGPGYGGYHRLKIGDVLDDLASLISRLADVNESSYKYPAIRLLLRAWLNDRYVEDVDERQPDKPTQNRFLMDFDLGYRLRRLAFIRTKIDEIYPLDSYAREMLAAGGVGFSEAEINADLVDSTRKELLAIKKQLDQAFIKLRSKGRSLRDPESGKPKTNKPEFESGYQLYLSILKIGMKPEDLKELPAQPDESKRSGRAASLLRKSEYAQNLQAFADKLCSMLRGPFDEAAKECAQILNQESIVARCLRHYYQNYQYYDLVRFPILSGTSADETANVDVIRVSPDDAKVLLNEQESGCMKLAGTSYFNFGGFLDDVWRQSDLLWGRLDAAERIINALLPPDCVDERRQLILEASAAILEEEIKEKGRSEGRRILLQAFMRTTTKQPNGRAVVEFAKQIRSVAKDPNLLDLLNEQELLDFYKNVFSGDEHPSPKALMDSVARSTRIVGLMLNGLSETYVLANKQVAATLVVVGRVFWGLIEVAVPRSVSQIIFRYWLRILYLFEVLMIVGGVLFEFEAVEKFGLLLLGITFLLDTVPRLLAVWMYKRRISKFVITLGVCLLVILLLLGGWKAFDLLNSIGGELPWNRASHHECQSRDHCNQETASRP
jgi:patatin-related protein